MDTIKLKKLDDAIALHTRVLNTRVLSDRDRADIQFTIETLIEACNKLVAPTGGFVPYPININEIKAPTRFTNFSNDELLIFRTALMNYWFIVATRFADSSYSVYVSLLDSLSDEILKRGLNNG